METRQPIDENIMIQIRTAYDYKGEISGSDFKIATSKILSDDRVVGIHWTKSTGGFGYEEGQTFYCPNIWVIRKRLENDEEFTKRMKEKVQREKQNEDRERLEYIRLREKYQNN